MKEIKDDRLVETIEESGYRLRVYKDALENNTIHYTFGVDNPKSENIRLPELTFRDGGSKMLSIVTHHENDLSSENAKELVASIARIISANDTFNKVINKYLSI